MRNDKEIRRCTEYTQTCADWWRETERAGGAGGGGDGVQLMLSLNTEVNAVKCICRL